MKHHSSLALIALLLVALLAVPPQAFAGDKGFSAGIDVREEASAADVGLPIYPGAVPQRDKEDDSPAVSLGLWGGSLGFKLVALSFFSADGVDTVARFYRDAMAKDGPVLECTGKPAAAGVPVDKKALSCADDRPEPGGRLYKTGTRRNFRVVSIEPAKGGVKFQLVRIEAKLD